jgi:hypothetical protein
LARDWAGSFDDAAERLHFYNDCTRRPNKSHPRTDGRSFAGTQHLDGDQSRLLIAHRALAGMGNR